MKAISSLTSHHKIQTLLKVPLIIQISRVSGICVEVDALPFEVTHFWTWAFGRAQCSGQRQANYFWCHSLYSWLLLGSLVLFSVSPLRFSLSMCKYGKGWVRRKIWLATLEMYTNVLPFPGIFLTCFSCTVAHPTSPWDQVGSMQYKNNIKWLWCVVLTNKWMEGGSLLAEQLSKLLTSVNSV